MCSVLGSVATLISILAAQGHAQGDPLQDRLDKAVAVYNEAVEQESKSLADYINGKITMAKSQGDLDLKKQFEAANESLQKGEMPTLRLLKGVVDQAKRDLTRAKNKLLSEYRDVEKDYVKQGNDNRAEAVRREAGQLDGRPANQLGAVTRPPKPKAIFLSELREQRAHVAHEGLGKGKCFHNTRDIHSIVDGKPSPHGLAMHPGDKGNDSFVQYALPPGTRRFTAIATLDKTAQREPLICAIQFEALVDGKQVWLSKKIDKENLSDTCDIPLPHDARSLELRTKGSPCFGGRAVWIEPTIEVDPAPNHP